MDDNIPVTAEPDGGPVDPEAEIAALKAERDALLAQVDAKERRRRRAEKLRSIGVVVLVVLACLCFIAANIGGWARRNLLDTHRFTDTAQKLIDDPDIEAAVSRRVTQQLASIIGPRDLFAEVLPARAQVLAVPLANAVDNFLGQQVDRFVASDAFEDLWVALVGRAHDTAVRILRGEPRTSRSATAWSRSISSL